MRRHVLSGALLAFAQMTPFAQETVSTSGQSLQGTWIAQVAMPSGELALFEVGTYYPGRPLLGATSMLRTPLMSASRLRTGDRQFMFTVMFFTHDEKGVFNGIVKARAIVTLAKI